mmetsp:Transcript_20303/g.62553  ORF Transcript_20303/g.62553 Transcript_20303/m.62553 type:complete len:207 (+) Transcript_20303:1105-1725(+)
MRAVFARRFSMRKVKVYFRLYSSIASFHTIKDSRDFCPTILPNIFRSSFRWSTDAFLKAKSAASCTRSAMLLRASSIRSLKDSSSAFRVLACSCSCIFVNCAVFPCQACQATTSCILHIRVTIFTSSFLPESVDIEASSSTRHSLSFRACSCAIINCSIIASVWSRCSRMRSRTCSISAAVDSLSRLSVDASMPKLVLCSGVAEFG